MSFGAFGQSSNQPATGLFGAQAQPSSLGLFGQQQQPTQQPGTGLFGQQQQPQAGGGLFGTTTTQQNQPAGSGGGLFGQPQQQQPVATGGAFFGNAQQQQQQPQSTGLFGQPQQPTAQPQTSAFGTGSLFGNASANTGQQNPSTGGLFGNNAPATTGGGLFGNTSQPVQNPNQQQQQQQPTASLFSNFGQTQQQQQQQPQSGGGLFGSAAQPQQQQAGNGGFGLFGSKPANSPSTFGQSTAGGASGSTASQPLQGGTEPNILERVEGVWNAWDTSSPACRFQHYFYNLVDCQQVGLYGKPPNATNDALWQKAVRENPDPSCLVPALALGFEDVKKRADAQAGSAQAQQQKLAELSSRLEAIAQKHTLSTSLRAQKASVMQTQIKQRITALVEHLHLLIPTVRSSSIRPEEEALRAALESIDDELKRPGGLGRLKGKLSELWTAVGALGAMKERARQSGSDGPVEWTVVDEDGLNELAQILHNEQQGLAHLTKILKDSIKDVEVIETGIGGRAPITTAKMGLNSSLSSASHLGRSTSGDLTTSMLRTR